MGFEPTTLLKIAGEQVRGQPLEEGDHRDELDELGQAVAVLAARRHRPLRHVRMLLAQEDPFLLSQAKTEDDGWNVLHLVRIKVFPAYIAFISAFTSQMALLGFIFSSLFISPGTSHLMAEDYSRTIREREHPPLCRDLNTS